MVIVKNPDTGKYEIRPSPPSFYESKPKSSPEIKPKQGVYYNIDDPNKTPQVRDGKGGFVEVKQPIKHTGGGNTNSKQRLDQQSKGYFEGNKKQIMNSLTQEQKDEALARAKAEHNKRFRFALSEEEKRMSTREIIDKRWREVGTGIVKGGVGLVEGGTNLVLNLPQRDPTKPAPEFRFDSDSWLGKQRDKPASTGAFLGQALVYGPAIGGMVTEFAGSATNVGVGTASAQTAGQFSPIRIPPQTFGPTSESLAGAQFEALTFKAGSPKNTVKLTYGKTDEGALLKSIEIKPKGSDFSATETDLLVKRTRWDTGKFTDELVLSKDIAVNKFGPAGVKQNIPDPKVIDGVVKITEPINTKPYKGSTGTSYSRTKRTYTKTPAKTEIKEPAANWRPEFDAGGVSRDVAPRVKLYLAGKGQRNFKFEGGQLKKTLRLSEKNINVKGVEVDVTGLRGRQDSASTIFRPRGKRIVRGPTVTETAQTPVSLGASISRAIKNLKPPAESSTFYKPVVYSKYKRKKESSNPIQQNVGVGTGTIFKTSSNARQSMRKEEEFNKPFFSKSSRNRNKPDKIQGEGTIKGSLNNQLPKQSFKKDLKLNPAKDLFFSFRPPRLPPSSPPEITKIATPKPDLGGGYAVRKRKKKKGYDNPILAQGFTAKALGLKRLRLQ